VVLPLEETLGEPGELEEEDVPGAAELLGVGEEGAAVGGRVGGVEDPQPLDEVGVAEGQVPGDDAAPVVADDVGGVPPLGWTRARTSPLRFARR
jgi:hypothetical protein